MGMEEEEVRDEREYIQVMVLRKKNRGYRLLCSSLYTYYISLLPLCREGSWALNEEVNGDEMRGE